jgi:uncharacterized membrane protein YhfC
VGEVTATLYDVQGRTLFAKRYHKQTSKWSQRLEFGAQSSGIKILSLTINGKVYKKKVLIR